MELDELRELWKHNQQGFEPKKETELAAMLKGRSKSIVTKLKWSVWFELVFTIVAGLILLYFAFTLPQGYMKWIFISFLILFMGYTIYYVKKINLLNRFDPGQDNIRNNLEVLVNDLSTYLRFYKKSYTYLYPFYLILMLLFMEIDRGRDEFFRTISQPKTILYLVGFSIVFLALSFGFTNWYLKKLYGNHLEKLKGLLSELQSS